MQFSKTWDATKRSRVEALNLKKPTVLQCFFKTDLEVGSHSFPRFFIFKMIFQVGSVSFGLKKQQNCQVFVHLKLKIGLPMCFTHIQTTSHHANADEDILTVAALTCGLDKQLGLDLPKKGRGGTNQNITKGHLVRPNMPKNISFAKAPGR